MQPPLRERFWYWLAGVINFWTDYCWGDLVLWSLGYIEFKDISKHKISCGYCDPRGEGFGKGMPICYGPIRRFVYRKLHPDPITDSRVTP